MALAFVASAPVLFDRLYERLQFKGAFRNQRFARIVENRHGVIAVTGDSTTYGGGLYVGLSTGAWAQVIANAPGVEHLMIVEINPGYLDLIRAYAPVASVLARTPDAGVATDDNMLTEWNSLILPHTAVWVTRGS